MLRAYSSSIECSVKYKQLILFLLANSVFCVAFTESIDLVIEAVDPCLALVGKCQTATAYSRIHFLLLILDIV